MPTLDPSAPLFAVVAAQIPFRVVRLARILKDDPTQLVISDRGR